MCFKLIVYEHINQIFKGVGVYWATMEPGRFIWLLCSAISVVLVGINSNLMELQIGSQVGRAFYRT